MKRVFSQENSGFLSRVAFLKSGIALALLFSLSPAHSTSSNKTPAVPEAYAAEGFSRSHTVNEVTGDMGLTLPLFTLPTSGDLEYRVVLSYQAGIALDQKASEVGLGWSLNHPVFHREVNGVPDDASATNENYYYYSKPPANYPTATFNKQKNALKAAQRKAKKSM